ncbi:MAG: CDP-alcohol phosphatidyltransferase family protein [Actinomycetota bacterium]
MVGTSPEDPSRAASLTLRPRSPVIRGGNSRRNLPNLITLGRTIACLLLVACAAFAGSPPGSSQQWLLLIAAYACYWVGDIADGAVARRRNEETRFGACFDIVCDRLCTVGCALAWCALDNSVIIPIGVFLFIFVVIDTPVSLSFGHWPILGPNYFGQVDRTVWLLNWTPPAKTLNTAGPIVAIAFHQFGIAASMLIVAAGVKIFSAIRVRQLLIAQ